jgi:toxin HigB-1
MNIYFRSKKLQKICSEQAEMKKQLGQQRSEKLQQRMAELNGADTLSDISHLPPCRCHELSGHRKGQFSVDLGHPYRILFAPSHDPVPRLENGEIDRNQVTEILIIEIVDTH